MPALASAQFSISGKITDQQTGATLPGATISINPALTTVSDAQGIYKFSNISNGNYVLKVSYIGYQTVEKHLALSSDLTLNIPLNTSSRLTEEVTISATRASNNSPTAFTNLSKKD